MAGAWQQKMIDDMLAAGAVVVPILGTGAASGFPDRIVVWRGWTLWVEFKAGGDRLKTNQRLFLESLTKRGVAGLVAYQWGEGARLELIKASYPYETIAVANGSDLLHYASLMTYQCHAAYTEKYSKVLEGRPSATDFEVRQVLEGG